MSWPPCFVSNFVVTNYNRGDFDFLFVSNLLLFECCVECNGVSIPYEYDSIGTVSERKQ